MTKFQFYAFFLFSRHQTECLIKFFFKHLITSLTFKFIFDANIRGEWGNGGVEREGKTEIQKSEYLENEKRFLDEMKNIFHIADTSFKL